MKNVGFIGLGAMGGPMAVNIMKAGFDLHIVEGHAREAVEELRGKGATVHPTAAEVAAHSDLLMSCLPDSPDVEEVYLGEGGALEGAKPGLIAIDASTIAPAAAIKVYEAAKAKGVSFIDAPVSGGVNGAIQGSLSVMMGGDKDAVDKAMPALNAIGGTITLVGPSGSGQVTKAANQIICSAIWEAVGESLVLAAKAGADPAKVLQAVSAGSGRGWLLSEKAPEILKRNFKPGFRAVLQLKDLRIALAAAKELGVALPATEATCANYAKLAETDRRNWDTSAVITVLEDIAGVTVKAGG